MQFNDFIKQVNANLPYEEKLDKVRIIVEATFDEIHKQIKQGEDVRIRGFGTFKCRKLAAREMKLPLTGEIKQLPERKKLVFSSSPKLVI